MSAIEDLDNPAPAPVAHEPHKLDCDLVVLGAGAAGLLAGVRVAELTGKKVIVLEKLKKVGGGGYYATGIRMFGTKWEKEAGLPDQMDDYIRAAMTTTRWELNPKLISNAFRALPRFFDWLDTWFDINELFELRRIPFMNNRLTVDAKRGVVTGRFLAEKYMEHAKESGVDVLTETWATDFVMDGEKVVGVLAKDKGGDVIISCSACLAATGSLVHSKQLEKCLPEFAASFRRRSAHSMWGLNGDAVDMAERAGIAVDYDSIACTYLGPMPQPFDMAITDQAGRSDVIRVGLDGKRWTNECFAADLNNSKFAQLKIPQCVSFSVFDSKILKSEPKPDIKLMADESHGKNIGSAVPDPEVGPTDGSEKGGMPNFYLKGKPGSVAKMKELAAIPGGHVCYGETLEELGKAMGVDVEVFLETIKRYNELCYKGHDDDFFKHSDHMIPIEVGPFFAIHAHMGTDGVFGGLDVDENLRVISNGRPVEGLYAAGDTTAGRYIKCGGEKVQIVNDQTWAIASGFVASDTICQDLGKK